MNESEREQEDGDGGFLGNNLGHLNLQDFLAMDVIFKLTGVRFGSLAFTGVGPQSLLIQSIVLRASRLIWISTTKIFLTAKIMLFTISRTYMITNKTFSDSSQPFRFNTQAQAYLVGIKI